MPTDDESKRRVSLLAKGLIGLAVLMVAAGTLYSRWAKQRDRDNALDDIAIGLDNTTLEFEHCITATTDPSAYGRGMFEQLRTRDVESDYERIDQLMRGDKLESGQLDFSDLPVFVDGMLHARSNRAEEFYMKAQADE